MQDLDGNVAGRYPLRDALENGVHVAPDVLSNVPYGYGVGIVGCGEIGFQSGLVYLCYSTHTQRLLMELFKDVLELPVIKGFLNDSYRGIERVRGGVGVEFRHDIAHFIREDVGPRSCPLTKLSEGRRILASGIQGVRGSGFQGSPAEE